MLLSLAPLDQPSELSEVSDRTAWTSSDTGSKINYTDEHTTVTIGPSGRQTTLEMPGGHDYSRPLPLVISLHGYSGWGTQNAAYMHLYDSIHENEHLLISPNGNINFMAMRYWNATDACCNLFGSNVDDVGYLLSLIDEAVQNYGADPDGVIVTGLSNGGFMSHRMACDAGSTIRAIVALNGVTWDDFTDCNDTGRPDILHVHSTADSVIRYDGGSITGGEYPSATETVGYWANRSGCDSTWTELGTRDITNDDGQPDTDEFEFLNCTSGNRVAHWRINGGGHVPPLNDPGWANQTIGWALSGFVRDSDGDGYRDDVDVFVYNPEEHSDNDADGWGDNIDDCDLDPTGYQDVDGDGVCAPTDVFPDDPTETLDSDGDGIGDNADTDDDNDGWTDEDELACMTDPDNATSVPSDTDADGICDFLDSDDDGDGYNDTDDAFPLDSSEWLDTDGDQIGDNSDDDDDDDGWSDLDEYSCGTDSLDYASQPLDTDGDAICDVEDEDDDNDGYPDTSDAFPLDDEEWTDTDGDNIGNNADTDDDGDGFSDSTESTCGSDSLDADSIPADLDQDGSCDAIDGDDDNDGYADISDAFPLDPNEWVDTDGDDIGDNADFDDDGDSVVDSSDAFPLDPSEWEDTDGDNIGDNSDLDDDNDGWSDSDEIECQTDPYSSISIPVDYDNDNICDIMDSDDDGDGVDDIYDMFQFDASEWDDLDLDGVGDNADLDDDGDGWNDIDEPNCGTNPNDANSFPPDFDMDGICDTLDPDDDNDLVLDINDDFQFDPSEHEDYDGDGIGDNADTDDDDDGWSDDLEAICQTIRLSETSVPLDTDGDGTCDVIDADDDGDGVGDPNDAFPKDPDEWEDRNGDGLGDRANPLSIIDHMKLNPIITGIVIFAILGAIGATAVLRARKTSPSPEDAWRDDDYSRYEETPSLVQEDSVPVEDTTDSSSATDELPDDDSENSDIAPDSTPTVKPPPPPPPGFEDVDFSDQKLTTRVENWEDLPDGGDYVQTEPMRYVGEECGTWIRQEDDSWILEE